jgi:hypothetical protein
VRRFGLGLGRRSPADADADGPAVARDRSPAVARDRSSGSHPPPPCPSMAERRVWAAGGVLLEQLCTRGSASVWSRRRGKEGEETRSGRAGSGRDMAGIGVSVRCAVGT